MAIDEGDQSDAGDFATGEASGSASGDDRAPDSDAGAAIRVGEYTWAEFMEEYGYEDEVSVLYPDDPEPEEDDQLGLDTDEDVGPTKPSGDDWQRVSFDPSAYLGSRPDDIEDHVLPIAGDNADVLWDAFLEYVDPETTPVVKDVWTWEHYKWEYYYEDDGSRPRDGDGEIIRHDKEGSLGFDPDELEEWLTLGADRAMELDDLVEERTVNVQDDIDEDAFFSTGDGATTLSNRYDLEKAVPMEKKTHYQEVERYWVNKPYAYVVIFHSEKENEKKYYMVEPYLNEIEDELQEFLSGKLRTAIKYSDDGIKEKANEDGRRNVIENETRRLLKRYDLYEKTAGSKTAGIIETIQSLLDEDEDDEDDGPDELEGIEVRPEPAVLADDPDTLNEYQVEKLLYLLKRNFIGYERIDGIKHDINVEDVSCDGYNSPVFVYHSDYEQIISNIYHGEDELDDFVVKLAQRSGKGISKRLPQVDATLPDGSRAQLTLGQEVSDHGTNYTIRQFKDVPFTPIDLINWNTFSLDEMAFLWLCIENHKSLIFAGGTASGKTTSLNAVSLFIPSSAKIVSIEDTREVELPQRNWIASVTRPSFSDDEQGDVDEFDLLEAALRQRPDYIVMGEIRGEEGRTLFQVMSTGHTTYTTFHADSVDEVLKRFTTDPINVSKTMFTALDLVSIQTQTRVHGRKVRRNKSLTEINHYEAENDEINVQDVYQWQAETDEYLKMGDSNTLEEIQFDRGWSTEKLEEELFKRKVILAYLIKNELNTYAEVAATAQAFINDPDTILTLIANGKLEDSLEDLREMESVLIDVDQEKEELVPRPEATTETYNTSMDILERAEESLFEEYRGKVPSGLASALSDLEEADPVEVDETSDDFDDGIDDGDDIWEFNDDASGFTVGSGGANDQPSWITDDTDFDVGFAQAETPGTAETTETVEASTGGASSAGAPSAAASTGSSAGAGASTSVDTGAGTNAGSSNETASNGPGGTDRSAPTATGTDAAESTGQFDMSPVETTDFESSGDSELFPADGDDDLGGLFENMSETLDEIDRAEERHETAGTQNKPTDDHDPAAPDDDFGSIFDPDADPGTASGDFTDQLDGVSDSSSQSATTIDYDEDVTENATESTPEADPNPSPSPSPNPASEIETADSDRNTDSTRTDEDGARTPPTIDVGQGDESADSDSDAISKSESESEADDTAPKSDADPPTIEIDVGADETSSSAAEGESTAMGETVGADDPDDPEELGAETSDSEGAQEAVSKAESAAEIETETDTESPEEGAGDDQTESEREERRSESPTDGETDADGSEDAETSIFGDETDPIFDESDAGQSDDGDAETSLFGDRTGGESETGADGDSDRNSIFEAEGETDAEVAPADVNEDEDVTNHTDGGEGKDEPDGEYDHDSDEDGDA